MRHKFKPAEIHTKCCKDKNLTPAKELSFFIKKGRPLVQGKQPLQHVRDFMSQQQAASRCVRTLKQVLKKLGNLFCSMLLVIRFIYKQYVQKYKYIHVHVALLTNLQTDCLKPDVFILRTDLCPFHDCVSCSLHATCHLF